MYAIVEMKGQQFRVEAGKKLFINRMNELEKGATVEFENVLLLDQEGKVKLAHRTSRALRWFAKYSTTSAVARRFLCFTRSVAKVIAS